MKTGQVAQVILASGSPRRKQMLRMVGIPFEVDVADVDERAIPYRTPREYAIKAAYTKAGEVAKRHSTGQLVIAADTIVVLDNRIYGKPISIEEARQFLGELSGRTHKVITGVAIQEVGKAALLDAVESEVHMHRLSSDEISDYVATGESMDKAGAYAIQGTSGRGIVSAITGDYFNVVGLPIAHTLQMLSSFMDTVPYRHALRNLTPEKFMSGADE